MIFIFLPKKIFVPVSHGWDEIGDFMVNNSKAFTIAKYAIIFAIIFVAMMIDTAISFIPLGFSMAVCVLLVTFAFCFLENKWSTGVLVGLFFGVSSFIKEFIKPSALLGQILPAQYWLLVTIPPRILMAAGAFGAYRLLLLCTKKINNAKKRQATSITVATFVGLLLNTTLFFSFVYLAKVIYINVEHVEIVNDTVWYLFYISFLKNILPEYSVSLAFIAMITLGVRRGLKLGIDGNNWKRAKQADEQTEI